MGACLLFIITYLLLFRFYPTRRRAWPDGCYCAVSSGEPTDIANAPSLILYFHGGVYVYVYVYTYYVYIRILCVCVYKAKKYIRTVCICVYVYYVYTYTVGIYVRKKVAVSLFTP